MLHPGYAFTHRPVFDKRSDIKSHGFLVKFPFMFPMRLIAIKKRIKRRIEIGTSRMTVVTLFTSEKVFRTVITVRCRLVTFNNPKYVEYDFI